VPNTQGFAQSSLWKQWIEELGGTSDNTG